MGYGASVMMKKVAYPHLCKDIDRQGHVRWRLRMPRKKTLTIKGTYGSEEFAGSYRLAVEGIQPSTVTSPARHGSVASVARSYLRSAAFSTLAPTTQRGRRYFVEKLVDTYGTLPIANMQRAHVKQIIERVRPGPGRNMLTALRGLIALAIEDGIRTDNPTTGIKRPKLKGDGWHSWTEDEIAQYEAGHPIGTPARLAFALALYTGQRASDLIRMGPQHVREGRISVRQQKTGTSLWIPIHTDLAPILAATPSGHLTFLVSSREAPFKNSDTFGKAMRTWTRAAGLHWTPLHGLRKSCCRRLAEAACTAPEIMAVSGHKSREVERYIRAAEQKRMADNAMARTAHKVNNFTTHAQTQTTHGGKSIAVTKP
jgi:integrase